MRRRGNGHRNLQATLESLANANDMPSSTPLVEWIDDHARMVEQIQDLKYGKPQTNDDPIMKWLRERMSQNPESLAFHSSSSALS
jgi:hypothetical protein